MERLPTFEVLIFGGPGVVIVMLPHPPDRPWRIGFDGSIDRHVAASFFLLSRSHPPPLSFFFVETALRNRTACQMKKPQPKRYCFKQEVVKSQQRQTASFRRVFFTWQLMQSTLYLDAFVLR